MFNILQISCPPGNNRLSHCHVAAEPLLLLGNLPAHDPQQGPHLLVERLDVPLPHLLHLLPELQYGLSVFTRDTLEFEHD